MAIEAGFGGGRGLEKVWKGSTFRARYQRTRVRILDWVAQVSWENVRLSLF